MAHHNATPYDPQILAKLKAAPYATMPQGGAQSDGTPVPDPTGRLGPDGKIINIDMVPGPGDLADDAVCATLNAEIAATVTPRMLVSGADVFNCIDETELASLSAAVQTRVNQLPTMPQVDISPGTRARNLLTTAFAGKPITLAALQALAAQFKDVHTPWWQSIGSNTPLNRHDLQRARTP